MKSDAFRSAFDSASTPSALALGRTLVISNGDWMDAGRAALDVYDHVISSTVAKHAYPARVGLLYYQELGHGSLFRVGLFCLQNAPFYAFKVLTNKHEDVQICEKKQTEPKLAQTKSVSWFKWVIDIYNYALFKYNRLMTLIYDPINAIVRTETERLEKDRKESAKLVGSLLCDCWTPENLKSGLETAVAHAVVALEKHTNVDSHSEPPKDPKEVLERLQEVLDRINSLTPLENPIPPGYVRQWPSAVVGAVLLYYALGSWRKAANWVRTELYTTVKSFYVNWVVNPLYRIYLTIRHDPNAKVALMGKASLESDLESLERMVVKFVQDSGEPTGSLEKLRENVRLGDLTPILKAYEAQIASPVSSLLSGGLVRTLLIQVQKTKVDAEVTLSGIDQMLQSQQLLFGMLALLPSLVIVFYGSKLLFKYSTGSDLRNMLSKANASKNSIIAALGPIEDICANKELLAPEDVGEVYCQVQVLESLTRSRLSRKRHERFVKDLARIVGVQEPRIILDNLLRIYSKLD